MGAAATGGRTTDPDLLRRVRDWRDDQAWSRFVAHYHPRLRAICRSYGLSGAALDDCCQEVWARLASTIQRFHYDPSGRFRYWLQSFFHSRVMDVLRASSRKYAAPALMGDPPSEPLQTEHLLDGCEHDPKILAMFRRAECVRETVRSRVKPETWEVFRLVAIEGFTVSQSAEILGKAYTTVFRSYKRVSQLVADERLRQQNLAGESSPQS